MTTDDLYRLAADFVEEHGQLAVDYAHRAAVQIGSDGDAERAEFWQLLSIVLDDIVLHRLDPDNSITIH
jgi:hypothetical protein